MPHGSANGWSKLTEAQVQEIRKLLAANIMPQTRIAKLYGVSPHAIGYIKTGRTWGWLPPES